MIIGRGFFGNGDIFRLYSIHQQQTIMINLIIFELIKTFIPKFVISFIFVMDENDKEFQSEIYTTYFA